MGFSLLVFTVFWLKFLASRGLNDHYRYRINVCAKVSGEISGLVEWIEFHRLQGVDHFVLYYDSVYKDDITARNSGDLQLLVLLYQQRGFPKDFIQIIPASILMDIQNSFNDILIDNVNLNMHRLGQITAYRHCHVNFAHKSEWMAYLDVDEFLYDQHDKKVTVWEYLHAIGEMYEKMTGENTTTLYPDHWGNVTDKARYQVESLVDNNLTLGWVYLKEKRLMGLFATPQVYGSNGKLWENRVTLHLDPITGNVDLIYDPRSCDKFEYVWSQRSKIYDNFTSEEWAKTLRDKNVPKMVSRLSEDLIHKNESELIDLFRNFLNEDFNPQDNLPLLFPAFTDLGREAVHFLETWINNKKDASSIINQPEESDDINDILDSIMNAYLIGWAFEYFPLTIEDHQFRVPSYTSGDTLKNIKKWLIETNPICKEYVEELEKIDAAIDRGDIVLKGSDPFPMPRNISRPYPLCGTYKLYPEYSDQTSMGKTIYWSGNARRIETKLKDEKIREYIKTSKSTELAIQLSSLLDKEDKDEERGDLVNRYLDPNIWYGCKFPWVHHCGHRGSFTFNETVARESTLYGLRINHYFARSVEKRTIGYPKWRHTHKNNDTHNNRRLPYLEERLGHLKGFEDFANYVFDPALYNWFADDVRTSIASFLPRPRFLKRAFSTDQDLNVPIIAEDLISKCAPGELMSEMTMMCPEDFPLTGLGMPSGVNPPAPITLGGFCMRKGDDTSTDEEMLRNARVRVDGMLSVKYENVVMCPGFPEISCCDYDRNLADYTSARFAKRNLHMSSWGQASVCDGCPPTR